jgi:COP9 signalosome complex subunit 1
MGQEDLGNHYFAIGDYPNAFKAYSRMREYCTSPKQIAQMTFKQLHVAVFQKNWPVTGSYQLKVQSLQSSETERAMYEPILMATVGLAHLQQSNYRDAAMAFLNVDHSYTNLEPQAGIIFQRQVISPNDVAVYGALCALAKMDRGELQRRVLENSTFRPLLELEPHLRRAISMFCASKYTSCLGILESYMADYLLDMYLQDHFLILYRLVRSKCLVQWFSAFSVVTWDEIEKAFPQAVTGMSIEQELTTMIKSGELDARLDLVDKVSLQWVYLNVHRMLTQAAPRIS